MSTLSFLANPSSQGIRGHPLNSSLSFQGMLAAAGHERTLVVRDIKDLGGFLSLIA